MEDSREAPRVCAQAEGKGTHMQMTGGQGPAPPASAPSTPNIMVSQSAGPQGRGLQTQHSWHLKAQLWRGAGVGPGGIHICAGSGRPPRGGVPLSWDPQK